MTVPASALATAVEIEADRFRNLKYDEAVFQKEARAVLGEYNKSASSPFLILNETMQDTAYTTHTYKHTTIGFLADIKDMPNQYRLQQGRSSTAGIARRTARSSSRATWTTTAGRAGPQGLRRLGARDGARSRSPPSRRRGRAGRRALTWPVPTLPILYLGYHIPAADPERSRHRRARRPGAGGLRRDEPALRVAGARGAEGRASCTAEAEAKRDPGLFTILARVRKPEDVAEVRKRIEAALAEAAETPIDAARLDAIKDHLRYAFAGSLDSPDAVALAVGQSIAIDRPPRRDERALRRLRAPHPRRPPARRRRATSPRPTRRS